jgi:predicted CXXCH cytochrome family protein
MEVEVTFLSRRGTAIIRRSQRASGERVQIGRGTDNEVPLNDIHVGLRAAVLVPRGEHLRIERLDNAGLELNGQAVESAVLRLGDEIRIGPYRIEVLAPPEGCDGAIQIELIQPIGAELERLNTITRTGLERTGASKRVYAWTGFLVVAAVCLGLPIVVFSGGMMRSWHKDTVNPKVPMLIGLWWNAGEFSNAHRFLAGDCATCHQGAFSRVADTACLACHLGVGNHVAPGINPGAAGGGIVSLRCVDCHTEHRGFEGNVIRTSGLCLDCHRDLAATAPAAEVRDVSGFPDGHPQFRVSIVAETGGAAIRRVELGATPPPIDHPGIKFSHKAHLDTVGATALGDRQVHGCADCHVAEPGGQGFLPITYKNQCQHCHELKFAKVALPWADATVPHGDDTGVIAAVWNFYAGQALRGGKTAPEVPEPPPVERRGAGMPAPSEPSPPPADTEAWVTAMSAAALRIVFDERRGCAYCHYGMGADGVFDADKILANALPPAANPPHVVAPVQLLTRFLPNARFDHAQHRGMVCADCHASAQAQSAGDVLIPGKENCIKCHGGENATLRARSTCISCHVFHRNELGPMRMSTGATQ